MFSTEFEKTAAFHYPGRAAIIKAQGHITKAIGRAAGLISPAHGGAIYEKGLNNLHYADKLRAERKAPLIAATLKSKIERKNYLKASQGRKTRSYKDETIARHAKAKAVKESMSPTIGAVAKEKSFLTKHPKTSLALGIGGTYALTRDNDNKQGQAPNLGY